MPGTGVVTSGGDPGAIAIILVVADLATKTSVEQQLYQAANQAWANYPETEQDLVWNGVIVITPQFIQQAKAKPGQVLFAEYQPSGEFMIRARLENPSHQAIAETYASVMQKLPLPLSAEGYQTEEDKQLSLGFGLFRLGIPDFLPNLPPIVWLIIALIAGYSSYNSKKTLPKIGLAAATWVAAAKFVKTQSNKFKL